MERSTNALAELAKDLKAIADWTNGGYGFTAISKAHRIVAELAKVEYGDDGHIRSWTDTEIKLKKCRAIAEEGAGESEVER